MAIVKGRLALLSAVTAVAICSAQIAAAGVTAIYGIDGARLFSIEAPDSWVLTTGREARTAGDPSSQPFPRVLGMHPEDDPRLWIGFFSPDNVADIPAAERYIRDLDGFLVEDPFIEFERDTMIEGRPAKFYRGGGRREGRPADFSVGLIQLPGKRVVIGVFVGENGAREEYAADIDGLVASFRAESDGGAK